ncbi:LmeA family phospholipid-binding protein [Actinoplanes subglobosus]|uniref:DUF2993 domain-containing protein n=1 Tax=Actinoplanes subglobosus TaxID=1547892 RepID=A0ABV8IT72_9ACTN
MILTLLVLLIAGVAVLDRFSNSYAENVLADKVAAEVANQKAESSRPVVTIAGVPFLTQVLAGKYEEIRIELPDFKAQTGTGETIRMDLLDIRARDVKAPLSALRGQGDVVAGSVTGTGTLDYGLLADATGQKGLTLAEKDGKLVGSGVVTISQLQDVQLSASADLKVVDGKVQVRFSDVKTPDLPVNPFVQGQVDAFIQSMAFELDVPKLPMNLVVQELRPLPEGLRVTFGASDVSLAAAGV